MKRFCLIASFMALLCINALAQNASIGDFQLPETKVERLFGSLNLNVKGYDTLGYAGFANFQYYSIYTSLPYSYTYGINLNTKKGAIILPVDSLQPFLYYPSQSRLYGDIKKYINDESMIFYGGQFNSDLIIYDETIFDPAMYRLYSKVGLGGGYGRIVPATGMAQALRIQEYLLNEKLITSEFSRETLIELASHCAKLNEYAEKSGDRHPIEWYTDLEKILVATGKLDNNRFSPYALLRVEEILARERIYERMIGWRLSGYLNYVNTYHGGYFANPINRFRNDLGTFLQLDLGYPITNNLHFNHNTYYNNQTNIDDGSDIISTLIHSESSIIYKLSNRIDFKIDYIFNSYNSDYHSEYQSLDFNMYYYIENNIFLLLNAKLTDRKDSFNSLYYNGTYKDISLSFGYRFF
jgi:hypothetical protein